MALVGIGRRWSPSVVAGVETRRHDVALLLASEPQTAAAAFGARLHRKTIKLCKNDNKTKINQRLGILIQGGSTNSLK